MHATTVTTNAKQWFDAGTIDNGDSPLLWRILLNDKRGRQRATVICCREPKRFHVTLSFDCNNTTPL